MAGRGFPRPFLGARPSSRTACTGSLSRGVKRPGRGVNHPPTSGAEVNGKGGAVPLCQFTRKFRIHGIYPLVFVPREFSVRIKVYG